MLTPRLEEFAFPDEQVATKQWRSWEPLGRQHLPKCPQLTLTHQISSKKILEGFHGF
jgi:hypothetical protein